LTRSAPAVPNTSNNHKRSSSNFHSPYNNPQVSRHRKSNSDERQEIIILAEVQEGPIPFDLDEEVKDPSEQASLICTNQEITFVKVIPEPNSEEQNSEEIQSPVDCLTNEEEVILVSCKKLIENETPNCETVLSSFASMDERKHKWLGAALSFGVITVTTLASLIVLSW